MSGNQTDSPDVSIGMRRNRILLVLLAIVAGVLFLQRPAAADCAGPTLQYESGEFDRLDMVLVTGQWFGTNCYDTGPPPDGEGTLGVPIQGIEILLVQGDATWVVGTGNAGEDYGFTVEVTLPGDLDPGEARITARWNGNAEPYIAPQDPITVTDAEVAVPETTTTAPFVTVAPELVTPESIGAAPADFTEDDDPNRGPLIALAVAIAGMAIVGLLVFSKR